ncbi:MAG TPA: methyltransferase [Pseudonocardiaceae bacterium]
MTPLRHVAYDELTVLYLPHLDGGGRTFGQDVVRFVRDEIGPVGHALEWCAGPGFIGLALLAAGLCDRLTLADVNPAAVRMARQTVRHNDLAERVDVVESDGLDGLPSHRFDLVVANPPHTPGGRLFPRWGPEILYVDQDWSAHRRFYAGIRDFLAPGGSIVLQENGLFSGAADFAGMITAAGLDLVAERPSVDQYYFVWSRNGGASC